MISQPSYIPLAPDPAATAHLFASFEGGWALTDSVRRALPAEALVLGFLHLGEVHTATACADAVIIADENIHAEELRRRIHSAPAGLALYLAGPEPFLWKTAIRARAEGLHPRRIHAAACGSSARRVYCLHCKTFTPGATTTLIPCAGCGLTLFVRDHFSKHLAAYFGIRADAESPGVFPQPLVLSP